MEARGLLERLGLRSRIARAAIACWLGDLSEARAWLLAIGRTVRDDGHALSWPAEGGLPGGGIVAGSDPISAAVPLLFATAGPWWPLTPEGRAVFEETRRAWERASRLLRGQGVSSQAHGRKRERTKAISSQRATVKTEGDGHAAQGARPAQLPLWVAPEPA